MTAPIKRILGIDSSTQGVAWCIIKNGKPEASGLINMTKLKGIQNKLSLVAEEYPKVLKKYKPQEVFIEKTISVRNAATFRVLSYVVGALMLSTLENGYDITDVEPSVWKPFLCYTNLSRKFVMKAKLKLGRLEGEKLCRIMRKSQTQNILKHNFPKFDVEDDNISDACAIGLYGFQQIFGGLKLEMSKDIAIDYDYLNSIGLGDMI